MENFKTSKKPVADLSFGRVPPQSIELEKAILGACLLDKFSFDIALETIISDCFYTDAHQRVFKSMQSLANKNMPIDLFTVVEELKKSNELELVGGIYAISKLTNEVVSTANLESHCRIVLQKFISREVIRVAGELITDAYDASTDAFELLDQAEEKVMKIGITNINGGMTEISTVLNDALQKIETWRQNDGTMTGVPSGFQELDNATRGWQGGELIILAARPAIGKTAIVLNFVTNAALKKDNPVTVAIWSLEMKAVYLALRMLAAESEIYLRRLQTGRLDEGQMSELINKGVNKLRQAKIFFDDTGSVNLRILRAKARKLKKKNKLGLIVIDYLQLMGGDEGKGNREQEISKISRGWSHFISASFVGS